MKLFRFVAAAAAVTLAFAQGVGAQDEAGGKYIGFSIGQSEIDGYCDGFTVCDGKNTGAAVYGGYNFHKNFAMEVGLAYLGESRRTVPFNSIAVTQRNEIATFYAAGVGKINASETVTLFGKAGVHRWNIESGYTNITPSTLEDDGIDFHYGIGGSASLPNDKIKLVLEYQVFRVTDVYQGRIVTIGNQTGAVAGSDRDIKQFNIGLTYTF
ncbi:MAG: outer membrane beta-barrel protein [Gammaproteobacteria bacterium]|nr:outer membrane beta-barrel protein [Gammaproteobacteria bacterium]